MVQVLGRGVWGRGWNTSKQRESREVVVVVVVAVVVAVVVFVYSGSSHRFGIVNSGSSDRIFVVFKILFLSVAVSARAHALDVGRRLARLRNLFHRRRYLLCRLRLLA